MMSAEKEYQRVCRVKSDIRDLLPVLYSLAKTVHRVTEFGTRHGVSLRAFLAAQPKRLISYDVSVLGPDVASLRSICGRTELIFRHGPQYDTLACPVIDRTGLLFIDTKHTGEQVSAELSRHADRVRHFIAFHDTHKFGVKGDGHRPDRPVEGLLAGIERWRDTHRDWRTVYESRLSNGLLVLQRECSEVTWTPPSP